MQASKRGQRVASGGLAAQALLIGLAIWMYVSGAPGAAAALWLIVAPVPIWVFTLILFYCRYLQRREEFELAELASKSQAESIFSEADEEQVHLAANRVRWMERWVVPVFTLLLAAYHLGLGVMLLRGIRRIGGTALLMDPADAAGGFFVALGGGFVAFLFGRYALGMAKVKSWRMLRAPGSYVSTNAAVFLLLAVVMATEYFGITAIGGAVAYVLPIFMIFISGELLLNFVLDLYRPRVPGADRRFSYDSRLLNLIASPERLGHSIAEAVNYQFGFEVSSTWFYRLLQRTIVPLLLGGALIIWLLTGVVVVDEGEQYVHLHLGQSEGVLVPRARPYLIWPWPIDTTRKFQTGRIHEIVLGLGETRQGAPDAHRYEEDQAEPHVRLWGEEHGDRRELDTLVARVSPEPSKEGQAPALGITKLVVSVRYVIDTDAIHQFGYEHTAPARLLAHVARGELIKYAASATLDTPLPERPGGTGEAIMTSGRGRAVRQLQDRISAAADRLRLGVKIVRVEMLACHPPVTLAEAFEKVAIAEREQERTRHQAQANARKILAGVAGDPDEALALAQEISILGDLERLKMLPLQQRPGKSRELQSRTQTLLDELDKEIRLESLLGRISPDSGQLTPAQRLRKRRQVHMDMLKAIESSSGYDVGAAYDRQQQAVSGLFRTVQGEAAEVLAQARATRWQKEFNERARRETFEIELKGYRAAPRVYRADKYLEVLTEILRGRRKYVLGVDPDRVEKWFDAEEKARTTTDLPLGPNKS